MNTLKVGDKAPSFALEDQNGNLVKSEDYNSKPYILFFYPKASTPGCTAEACSLRDGSEDLQKMGYQIIGVSADTVKRQSNFATKQRLNYPLLSDEDKVLIQAYGVWGLKKFMGKEYDGIHRKTFVIGANGLISNVIDKVKTKTHFEQLVELLK
ncbi:MAG: thioredoxin-dependent thiol peroxidase [Flavobacteriaceae bacterium]